MQYNNNAQKNRPYNTISKDFAPYNSISKDFALYNIYILHFVYTAEDQNIMLGTVYRETFQYIYSHIVYVYKETQTYNCMHMHPHAQKYLEV